MSTALPAVCERFGCSSPATVDGLCATDWWIVQAEVADGMRELGLWLATLTERDAAQASSAVRRGPVGNAGPSSRSVSVPVIDHDPGDCGCEDCR